MAKGKKKGGGKKEDQSSESNVPSEQPSTSTAAEPEEEEFGLTGKPSKKQLRQQKKAAKHETPFHDKPQKEIVTEAQTSTSVAGSESSSEVPSRSQSEAPEETKQDVSKPDEIVEEFQGLLAPKKKPYRKKKKIAAEEFPTPQVATQGPVEPFGPRQLQPPASLQPLPLAAQQTGPALVESQPTPSASGWSSGRGWSCPPPGLPKATPSPGEQASSSVAPAGRGRGWPAPGSQPSTPLTSPGFPPQPSTSVTSPVVHSLAPQMKTSQRTTGSRQDSILCRYRIPQKISTQTIQSRKIKVITNYLEMKFKCLSIARYDVSFSPDRPKKMLPRVFQQVKNEFYSKELIAFDQMKNCYSLNPLPNVTALKPFHTTVTINDANDKSMSFDVTVKFTGMVDLSKIKHYMDTKGTSLAHPTEEVQCIDVILRQGTLESYVKAGRQFFKRPAKPIDLGHGYEMWTGLFQSAIFTEKSFINIDVAHKGFPKAQPLVDALKFDFNLNPNAPMETQRPYEVEFFTTFIKGLKVVATLVGSNPRQTREFIVNEMVAPPEKMSFMLNDPKGKNRMITVADYFAQEKGYRLQYPKLNCVWVGPKDKNIYFPMELLAVAGGQAMTRQLNEFQVAKMVREAATPPDERLRKITDVKSAMRYSKNQDFINFGLTISDKFHEVQAKVLFPPVLDTGRLGPTTPNRGQWQANSLLRPKPLESWGFVAVETDPRNEYDSMINLIMSTAKQIGMPCSTPNPVLINVKLQALHSILLKAVEKEVRFLFIIVSSRGRDHYHKVKQMAECHVGILTQCVREQTCRKMNPMTAKNILLKVNSKLMGINQAIEPKTMPRCLKEGGVMIVGADVTHPSPDQSNVPSIAAVTASLDPKCYIYNIELSVQTPKKEMIVEFEDMMVDHLKLYRERNNELPRKIFVFRDGVSEGQFAQVMNSELQAIHDAYRKLAGANKKPEILFLLVQKRHHTRLFLEGRNHNVEPGTVVDKDIVHASELDFYLVSHQAIKGTARPTRYHAVCNDGRIPDDEVEQLTYYLCHLYSRCMRSVSYPTPTYYAHLACLRARSLTHGEKFNNKELEQTPRRLRVLDKMLKFSRMFFV